MKIKVRILSLTIRELHTNELIGIVHLQRPFVFDGRRDLVFDQTLRIDVSESIIGLKTMIKRVAVVGLKEIARIMVKIEFNLSFSINDLFVMERIACTKTINIGNLLQTFELNDTVSQCSIKETQTIKTDSLPTIFQKIIKSRHLAHLQKPLLKDHLFPQHEILPFAKPGLRGIEAGLDIKFCSPPELNFSLGKIKCKVLLNGATVARTVISGIYLSNTSHTAKLLVKVQPAALSSKPISGALSTAKGILIGAVKGAANGLMYKDWGGKSVVLGIKDISIENQDARQIWWVDEILQGLEYEYDLDAARKVGRKMQEKTFDIKDGIHMMIMKVIEESNCPIM